MVSALPLAVSFNDSICLHIFSEGHRCRFYDERDRFMTGVF